MPLESQPRQDIVAYRLEKAYHTLKEAKDVAALGYWNLAANRLYYSAYYASAALLIHYGIEASSHKGTVKMIGLFFVKQGILNPDDSRMIGKLFTMRQTGDYEDLYDWNGSDVDPMFVPVEDYINRISAIIVKSNQENLSESN